MLEPFELLSEGEVEQVIDRGRQAVFHKQLLELPGDVPLSLVRKHEASGPTRPPVVLIHGFAQNRYSWHTSRRSLVNWLAERGWDVWNLELRGHGRSRSEASSGAEVFADYVHDVGRVARALDGQAYFVGHSLGGAACYGAATTAPMRGVVGIGALFAFGRSNPLLRLATKVSHELRHAPIVQHFTVRTRSIGTLLSKLYAVSDVAGYTVPLSGWWPGSLEPELLEERLTTGFDWTSVQVWLEMSRWAATGVFDYEDAWRHTHVPLLVMAGDKDHLMPAEDARRAYDLSPADDKTLVVFDDFHHEVHWGHLDLVLGKHAPRYTWPCLHEWLKERAKGMPAWGA